MATTTFKPGQSLTVKITKAVTRDAARKTLERLFLQDKAVASPIARREANFKDLPKRRGGRIWTKRPNKVHPQLPVGSTATLKSTPQTLKDLNSVKSFVEVSPR